MGNNEDTLAKRFRDATKRYADNIAQLSKNEKEEFGPTSYQDLSEEVKAVAAGLHRLGVNRGEHVGLISDNRKEWMLAR